MTIFSGIRETISRFHTAYLPYFICYELNIEVYSSVLMPCFHNIYFDSVLDFSAYFSMMLFFFRKHKETENWIRQLPNPSLLCYNNHWEIVIQLLFFSACWGEAIILLSKNGIVSPASPNYHSLSTPVHFLLTMKHYIWK